MKKIIIHKSVLDNYPDFFRGIVIVKSCDIKNSNNRIRKLLKKTIDERFDFDIEGSVEIAAWDDAHRKFGSSPEEFYPSIKSLLLRIKQGQGLPFINTVVALMNYISLKYLLPCGGDDIAVISGNIHLMHAKGDERFVPLGEPNNTVHNPDRGEVIYASDDGLVMCRKWNWRNGNASKIDPSSKTLVMNIDCLPPIDRQVGISARDELADLLTTHCDAMVYTDYLDITRPNVDIDVDAD
uniref:B3/B4 domain-containing protein (DNA/RNA-binding domain of Phe-tRNA-synthetase) n=1 Tax=Candidatus Kentrum sp. LFY TaxID=2126342 RepID=A0A450WT50_9GAMM|nr:MAG: B3/B4 domain-containing protein (DNA/RNA-binding domain of Phe-tRNA-synthetase) [Candidatus Kentron sp. LFY]